MKKGQKNNKVFSMSKTKKLSVSIFLILTLFFLPLISALTISETHLTTTGNLYDIYVNGSITIDNLTITNTTISIYSLNGTGNFTSVNNSQLIIYNLTSSEPYNDVKYNNGTIIGFENIRDNYTIIMNAGQYFQIGNFSIPSEKNNSYFWCNGADMNRNGFVDAADYTLWKKYLNCNVSVNASCTNADANKDGIVNQSDYDRWRANFGSAECNDISKDIIINQKSRLVLKEIGSNDINYITDSDYQYVIFYKSLSIKNMIRRIMSGLKKN